MPSVPRDRGLKLLLLIAAFIIFCAGLKAASSIIVPVLAAIFVSIISIPPLQFLRRIGFPGWLAEPWQKWAQFPGWVVPP